MKTKELYFVSFISLFVVIFVVSAFSSGITGMAAVSSDISIIGQAYKFTLEQFKSGGTLNKMLLAILLILIIFLIIEIIMLILKSQKRTKIKKIKYMIDSAEQELKNKNFIKARDVYTHIREEFNKLSEASKEKIKTDCLNLYEKIKTEIK